MEFLTSEISAVEGADCCRGRSNGRTLDVHVALGRLAVDENVQNSAVFVAFLDHVVLDVTPPRWVRFSVNVKIEMDISILFIKFFIHLISLCGSNNSHYY